MALADKGMGDPRMESVSDDDLVLMYRNGDADAFDALFDRYSVPAYNFARTVLGRCDGADEVLQETFLAVARGAHAYTPQGRFRFWLMRIVRNRCLSRIEAERTRKAVLSQGGLERIEPASREPPPETAAQADELAQRVRSAIAALPDRQREVIALYAFEQMQYRQIAEVLETPVNTVKTLIRRARAALAQALEPYQRE
jgi:RNA polymerase sigma-70 factor, ECF subfamily